MVEDINMNICFVSNFSKTILYREIANKLKENNVNVYWIFVDSSLVKFAEDDSYLYFDLSVIDESEKIEVCDIPLNEILLADRFISLNKNGRKYLTNIQTKMFNFIKNNNIRYIFGERTWAHELLLSRIVQRCPILNCKYFSFTTVRIPSERFAFFEDEKEECLHIVKNKGNYLNFDIKTPDYMNKNITLLRKEKGFWAKINKIKRFITKENIIKDNPCLLHSFIQRFRKGFVEEFNKFTYKFIKKEEYEKYKSEKYIFYGFHKQPESSIDICGMYYENQYQNIYNLWRILPSSWYLLVKEHVVAIGDRSYNFYRKIQKLSNVIIIKETADSHEIIKNAMLSATVTGTIALEAGLMGKNAITFGKPFFTKLPNIKNVSYRELSDRNVFDKIVNFKISNEEIENYKKYISENSYEGNVLDPITDPDVLEEANINKICRAFMDVLNDN